MNQTERDDAQAAGPAHYWGYCLFASTSAIEALREALAADVPFVALAEQALLFAAACDLLHLQWLHSVLCERLSAEQVASVRIFAAAYPDQMANPLGTAGHAIPLARFVNDPREREAMEPVRRPRLVSVFQPIYALTGGQLIGHELLVRGLSERGTVFGAGRVLEHARRSGCEGRFDEVAHAVHLEQIAEHRPRGLSFLNFVPAAQAETAWRLERLLQVLRLAGRPPDAYVLEVVCTGHLAAVELRTALRLWRDAGFLLAIDDWAGDAQGAQLLESGLFAFIKLDISLIRRIEAHRQLQQQVGTIVARAHSHRVRVIAEGIERPEELAECRRLGIDGGQGFLLGRPAPEPSGADLVLP